MFKLALSAGHYLGSYKGCPKKLDPKGTKEWSLNSRICNKIEKILSAYDNIEILRLDDVTGKTNILLSDRTNAANKWGASFYLSIHHNGGINGGAGGGIVAFAYTSPSKESIEWQKALYDAAIAATGLVGNRATPLAKKNLHEVRESKMPAVLMECGFMDSATDCPIILTEAYADKIARAFCDVIVKKSGAELRSATMETEKVEHSSASRKEHDSDDVSEIILPNLKNGSKGEAVKTLQRLLASLGFTDSKGKKLAVDGSFGKKTLYALEKFQKAYGIDAKGCCENKTWTALLFAK